jgi:hypothetical protein
MAEPFGSFFSSTRGKHERTRQRSLFASRSHRRARRLALTGTVLAAPFALALAMLPLAASPAAAAGGAWTATITGTSGVTTTGIVATGTVTPNGDDGFAYIVYEPTGTPLSSTSPTAGCVNGADGWICANGLIFDGQTTSQNVSITIDQLTPNTAYHYELQAEDDNGSTYDSTTGTFSTTPAPTGPGTPINPPSNPSSDGIFGQCSGDAACVNDMNGVRANQEQLPALSLPSNWSSLSGIEQMFVWTNLERLSRGEAAIPNLVNTYNGSVQTGLTDGDDPSLSDLPGNSGSIWAGAYATVLGAIYGWMYDDGFGGGNEDCTTATAPGCWGHRDNILADPATFGGSSPTEMDAGVGTESGGSVDYDAIFVANPNPTAPGNIVFTWAEEQALVGGSPPSISGVTLTGTPAAPTITVTGSNFGASAPADSPETCQNTDTGDIFSGSELVFQDLTEGWGAGEAGDCIGLLLTSWSSTKVVFTMGSQYANYGPIAAGDQVKATIAGATDTVTASFTAAAVPTITSSTPTTGPTTGGTTVTITGTNFTGATGVTFGAAGAAKSFTVVSTTEITAVTAAAPAGEHYVTVTTPGGTSADKASVVFTYAGAPTVTSSTPATGPTTGGTTVTITGTNFTGATGVTFGAAGAAKSFTVVSSTKITAVTAAAGAGEHYVTVTTPSGTSPSNANVVFTYVGAPTVTSSTPTTGPTTGGTTVTITGTNFTGATGVTFGAAGAAKSFTVVSSTKITAVTAAAGAGEHYVTVTTPSGTSPSNANVVFTYVASASVPTITSSSPPSGPTTGGTTVTIIGTNFTGATAVTFGAAGAAKSFTVVSSTEITAVTAAAGAGEHYVTVTTPAGTSADKASVVFTYN